MGAFGYWYYVPFEEEIEKALEKLKLREFKAGSFYPNVFFPHMENQSEKENPDHSFNSISEVRKSVLSTGTRSILDIDAISNEIKYNSAKLLSSEENIELFGTEYPTREELDNNFDFIHELERGTAICLVLYKEFKPNEFFFAGYSFD